MTGTREEWLAARLDLLEAASLGSNFNHDFGVTHTEEEWQSGAVEYNFRETDFRPAEESPVLAEFASTVGTDFATHRREDPGVSAFAPEDGVVCHTREGNHHA